MTGVSIVIPHFGPPEITAQLLGRLKCQKTSLELQMIVSDDASPMPFPNLEGVEVVRRSANGGFGAAVNSAVPLAVHEFLLIVNSDVIVSETFIDELITEAYPWMPAVVSPWVVTTANGGVSWTGRHFPQLRHQFVEWLTPLARWRGRRALHEAVGHDTRAKEGVDTVVDWVVGAVLLMPTAEFRAVGGFDERFFMNSEEVDLQRRLRDRGVLAVALGAPIALHEGGGSSDPLRRRTWLVESRLSYAEKWSGRRRLVLSLTAATGVNLVWNTGRWILGRQVRPVQTARQELGLLSRGNKP